MSTNIYIVEDHELLKQTLQHFLNHLPDIHVCGTSGTAQEARVQLPTAGADIVLVNVSLPDMPGYTLVRELKTHYPHLACIMLASTEERFYVQQALAAGARGYIVKGDPDEYAEAIHQVMAGNIYLSS
jgi:DNA-binding NarL/FixJ family response regulator